MSDVRFEEWCRQFMAGEVEAAEPEVPTRPRPVNAQKELEKMVPQVLADAQAKRAAAAAVPDPDAGKRVLETALQDVSGGRESAQGRLAMTNIDTYYKRTYGIDLKASE